jgi:hypothetical protein
VKKGRRRSGERRSRGEGAERGRSTGGEAAERRRMRRSSGEWRGSGGGGCGGDELIQNKLREAVCYAVRTMNSYTRFSLNLTFVLAGP